MLTLTSMIFLFFLFYSLSMQCCSLVYDAEYIYLFLYVTRVFPFPPIFFLALINSSHGGILSINYCNVLKKKKLLKKKI